MDTASISFCVKLTVPAVYHSLREEAEACVSATLFFFISFQLCPLVVLSLYFRKFSAVVAEFWSDDNAICYVLTVLLMIVIFASNWLYGT